MSAIFIIAGSTLREAVRARVFLYLLVVAMCMIAASVPTAELGVGEELRLITDVSMAASAYVCVFLAVFLGVSAVSGEVDKRTVYTIIAKQASRAEFVVGKLVGVWATVALAVTASYAMIIGLVSVMGQHLATSLLTPFYFALLEMALLVAVATFFSCITRPLLASGLTVAVYLIGVSLKSILFWVTRSDSGVFVLLCKGLYWLFPNFQIFDVRTEIVNHVAVAPDLYLWSFLYCAAYLSFLLSVAIFIFQRRDLK